MFKSRTIGIIGAGEIVFSAHLPFLKAVGAEPKWLVDISEKNAKATAKAFGIPATYRPEELAKTAPTDVVLIACPYGVRKPYYEYFRSTTAALYLEKPVARSLREHEEIAALRPPHAIGAGFLRRSFGITGIVKGLIEDEIFGKLRRVRHEFGSATQASSGGSFAKNLALAGGGQLFESAIHNIDAICYAANIIHARVLDKNMEHENGFDLHTEAVIELQSEGQPPVEFELLVTCFKSTGYDIEMTFDNAVLTFSLFRDMPPEIKSKNGTRNYRISDAFAHDFPRQQYDVMHVFWSDFLRAVDERKANYTSLCGSVATTQIIEQLYSNSL